LHADSVFSQRFTIANPVKTENDTLQLADSVEYTIIKAYHKVRFFKSDLQGVCDSLHYNSLDSLIWLHTRPVIWHEVNQLTGRSVQLRLINNQIEEIFIDAKAFLVEQDDSTNFNQMKGNTLKGFIRDNQLYRVDIQKNGEFLYFMRDDGELIGVNKQQCNNITANLVDGKLSNLVFRTKPQGFIDPPNEVNEENSHLDDFEWHNAIRPVDRDDIFDWR